MSVSELQSSEVMNPADKVDNYQEVGPPILKTAWTRAEGWFPPKVSAPRS